MKQPEFTSYQGEFEIEPAYGYTTAQMAAYGKQCAIEALEAAELKLVEMGEFTLSLSMRALKDKL